jgi:hypothetical protein
MERVSILMPPFERGDVDDLASAPAGDHPLRRLAADLECPSEMDFDHTTPLVGLEIHHRLAKLNAGVVDEDVDLDACSVEMFERCDDRSLVGDIEGARFDLMPGFRKRLGGIRQLLLVAAVENESGAGGREAARHGEPKPLRGSGDQRRLAGQVEKLVPIHRWFSSVLNGDGIIAGCLSWRKI